MNVQDITSLIRTPQMSLTTMATIAGIVLILKICKKIVSKIIGIAAIVVLAIYVISVAIP
jgi:hypothetical protein